MFLSWVLLMPTQLEHLVSFHAKPQGLWPNTSHPLVVCTISHVLHQPRLLLNSGLKLLQPFVYQEWFAPYPNVLFPSYQREFYLWCHCASPPVFFLEMLARLMPLAVALSWFQAPWSWLAPRHHPRLFLTSVNRWVFCHFLLFLATSCNWISCWCFDSRVFPQWLIDHCSAWLRLLLFLPWLLLLFYLKSFSFLCQAIPIYFFASTI